MKKLSLTVFAVVCVFSSCALAWSQSALPSPTLIYSTAAPLAIPNGSPWNGPAPCTASTPCYRIPLETPAITGGSTLVMMFGYDSTSNNQVFSVTDDKSNSWVLDVVSSASNSKVVRMYRAANVAAGTSYVNIQLTSGSQNGFWQPLIAEFYNVGAIDGSSCFANTSATVQAGNITPTVSGDLILQAKYSANQTSQTASFTAGSQPNISWSLASQLLGDGAADQYGVYNSTATLNPQFGQASSDAYISCAVALKAASAGSAPTAIPRIVHQEHDAMPRGALNPWTLGMIATQPGAIYISAMENDPITSLTSSAPPDVGWAKSGPDHVGTNGHNNTYIYCAQFYKPPGPFTISVTRSVNTNDSIFMVYEVIGGTCTVDADFPYDGVQQSATSAMTICSGCLTPTKPNDFILANEGQGNCTVTSLVSPTGGILDSAWFSGNTIDGPTQTDENNGWMHYYNGSSLSPITVTLGESCASGEGYWAGRVAAYQSVSTGAPQPPTGLSAIVH
jgi:hypothetical protein